jgi:hypothetical protein
MTDERSLWKWAPPFFEAEFPAFRHLDRRTERFSLSLFLFFLFAPAARIYLGVRHQAPSVPL